MTQKLLLRQNFIFSLAVLLFITTAVQAQLLDETLTFTRADTLRGSLNENRDWFDVVDYDLNLSVFPEEKMIAGSNLITFKVLRPHQKMQIDLFDELTVDSIIYRNKKCNYLRDEQAIIIELAAPAEKASIEKIQIYYHGQPIIAKQPPWDGGFVWSKDKNGKDWIGVACEGIGASLWWPNKDHLSDEPDSMTISLEVPKHLVAVANGNLRSTNENGDRKTWTWEVNYPINNYNVSLNIADYIHFDDWFVRDSGDSLALDYYVLSYNLSKAKKQFEQVPLMLESMEEFMGEFPFPDDGFALVETPYLGMEHQSCIAYGNDYQSGYRGNRDFIDGLNFDYIILHEMGHEWWGNSISCDDMADLWIHESFCTYSESFYIEYKYGKDRAVQYINCRKGGVKNQKPVTGVRDFNNEGSSDMYDKGSLMLNSLRHTVKNDDLWLRVFKEATESHFKHQVVRGADIIRYFNEGLGMNLSPIFDHYLTKTDIPVLEYRLKKKRKGLCLEYRWQGVAADFNMPVAWRGGDKSLNYLHPSLSWQKAKIKTEEKAFKWAEELFYANYEKVD